jgi:hypothetical protein
MRLELYNKEDQMVAVLAEDDKMLGYYPVDDFYRLNVRISMPIQYFMPE